MIEDAMPRGQGTGDSGEAEDSELLRRYAEEKSEAAFAELVRRHVNFVYACALRRVGGDAHLAEDVTQQVFTALARNGAALARREVLSGWLFTTARNASAQVVRTERRRLNRETEAQLMNELTSSSAHDAEWERLRPVLDDALDGLSDDDRQAVLLRFFEGKSFADVGAKLRLAENTARMRVDRALDKLHAALARRGVTSTTAALAVALANQVGVAAPAGLAASVTGVALASGGAMSAGAWLTFMSMSKLQIGLVGAVAVAGAAGYVAQANTNAGLRREIAVVQAQRQAVVALRAENQRLASEAAEVGMLRRDDAELRQLEQRVAAAQQALKDQRAREAAAQLGTNRAAQEFLVSQLERLNLEGRDLILEQRALKAKSGDPSLPAEARAEFAAAAERKMEEVKAKLAQRNGVAERARAAGVQQPGTLTLSPSNSANGPAVAPVR